MLPARRDAVLLQAADDRGTQPGDGFRILAERAVADDRIARVGVDVEHGREIERDADGLELRGERRSKTARQRLVAGAAERRHRRPLGERRTQARDASTLL